MGKWILVEDKLPSIADAYITTTRNSNVPTVSFFDGKSFDKKVDAWYTTSIPRLDDEFDEWLANEKGE